ncbi:DUF3263 domain-containing protein [Microbacterium resistens]|uniref:DUF3263 domain-containing protein n=1 Tax=Microbacterium resistens TaxID=156977 RepID=UPI0037C6EEDB
MSPAELLAFEAAHPGWGGVKDDAIRTLGLTPARYVILLDRAARSPEGIAADPITARRSREPGRHTTRPWEAPYRTARISR